MNTVKHSSRARAFRRLAASRKFLRWALPDKRAAFSDEPMVQKHYSPAELAQQWGVSVETIRTIFRLEPGVLKIGSNATRHRRGYKTLRIPETVAKRVHQRLGA